MNVINKVTLQHMKLNKKRTLVTILGIIVSVAMIMAVSTSAYSFLDAILRDEMASSGKWHVLYQDVAYEKTDELETDSNTKNIMLSKDLGYAKLEGSKNKQKPYVYMKAYDAAAFEGMPISLVEGRLASKENEVVISAHILDNAQVPYKIGDVVTYQFGHRSLKDESGAEMELGQDSPYLDGDQGEGIEVYAETEEGKEYTIVGIVERPKFESTSAPGYTIYTYLDTAHMAPTDLVNASVLLKKVTPKIYKNLEAMATEARVPVENIVTNDNLLAFSGASYDDSFNKVMFTLVLILIVIIMTGSISLIYNAFAISISERSKHLGMLASVGATKKQKRSSVFYESFLVGTISIPIGILAGIAGMATTFFFINPIFKKVFDIKEGLRVIVNPETLLVAVIFSIITIFISAYIPARRASKISPIDAIRQTNDIKLKSKTVKTSRLTRKLFGFEGELALKNLKRYKRRYRATVFSLIISLLLFLTASAYGFYLKNAFSMMTTQANYDAAVLGIAEEKKEMIPKIKEMASVTEFSVIRYHFNALFLNLEASTTYRSKEFIQYAKENDREAALQSEQEVQLLALDDASFASYAKQAGADLSSLQEEEQPSAILINQVMVHYGYSAVDMSPFAGKEGAILPLQLITENYDEAGESTGIIKQAVEEIRVACITKEVPMGLSDVVSNSSAFILIVSEQTYEKISATMNEIAKANKMEEFESSYNVFLNSKVPKDLEKEFITALGKDTTDSATIFNTYEQNQEADRALLLIGVFAYGFITLITIICVANIFNTISTSIGLRRREFAMLKSVGMTPKSFNKMIAFESIFYGMKALLYGLPLGFGIIYLVYKTISFNFNSGFTLPWGSILVGILSVFLVVGSSMLYSSGKIKKENVIDALKSENM